MAIEEAEELSDNNDFDKISSEESFPTEYGSDDSHYSLESGIHYRRLQHLSDWCSEYIKENLDTGYDLLRNIALLSASERDKITIVVYTFINDVKNYFIRIATGIYIRTMTFSSDPFCDSEIILSDSGFMLHGKTAGHYYSWHGLYPLENGYYENGKRSGRWRRYMWTDRPVEEGFYKDGERTGYWYSMDINGKIIQSEHYKNGIRVEHWLLTDYTGKQREKDY